MYLPFDAQHGIFVNTQRILEKACFNHMKHRLPHVLEENGWKQASQVDLVYLPQILRDNSEILGLDRQLFDQDMADMEFLHDIRRIAVEKGHPTAKATRKLLNAAVLLVTAFGDTVSASTLGDLGEEMQKAETAMYDEGLKMMADAKEDFHRQRKELEDELNKKEADMQAKIMEQISDDDAISSFIGNFSSGISQSVTVAPGLEGQRASGSSQPGMVQSSQKGLQASRHAPARDSDIHPQAQNHKGLKASRHAPAGNSDIHPQPQKHKGLQASRHAPASNADGGMS